MRLAIFTNQFPGRVSTFFARDVRALIEAGVEVEVFAMYPLDQRLWQYVPDILSEEVLPRNRVHHASPLTAQSIRAAGKWLASRTRTMLSDTAAITAAATGYGPGPLSKSLYVLPKAWAWAQQYQGRYDHILAYWGNYAATCAYVFHRLDDRPIPFSMFLHAGTDLYRTRVFMRQKLLYADNVIVVCDFNRIFLQEHYSDIYPRIADNISLHYLGLDFTEFPFIVDGRLPRKVLAVGGFNKQKGFDYLLRAVGELKQRGVEIEVEMIGDGREAGSLQKLSRDLGIADRVSFRGWLPFEAVKEAMGQATILVHPSNGLGDAVPTVIKEAMAVGLPVIASHVAGIPELLNHGQCGTLVPPKDVRVLADSIETLLQNEEKRREYAYAARAFAEEHFDMWRNGQRLAEILGSTVRAC